MVNYRLSRRGVAPNGSPYLAVQRKKHWWSSWKDVGFESTDFTRCLAEVAKYRARDAAARRRPIEILFKKT